MSEQTSNLVLAYSQQDEALAARLKTDLQARGYTISPELTAGTPELLIVLISPTSADDKNVQTAIAQALNNGQHIIPLQVGAAPLPDVINDLQPLNFSEIYPIDALLQRMGGLSFSGANSALKIPKSNVRRANRSTAYWLTLLAILWFIIGIIGVGILGIQLPNDEYDNVDTEVAATVGSYLDVNMPRTTQDAINFPATLQAAPTVQQPFLIATATALAAPK